MALLVRLKQVFYRDCHFVDNCIRLRIVWIADDYIHSNDLVLLLHLTKLYKND